MSGKGPGHTKNRGKIGQTSGAPLLSPLPLTLSALLVTFAVLAISRSYVRAHGGAIPVSSQQGLGSAFTVRLPVQGPSEAGPA